VDQNFYPIFHQANYTINKTSPSIFHYPNFLIHILNKTPPVFSIYIVNKTSSLERGRNPKCRGKTWVRIWQEPESKTGGGWSCSQFCFQIWGIEATG